LLSFLLTLPTPHHTDKQQANKQSFHGSISAASVVFRYSLSLVVIVGFSCFEPDSGTMRAYQTLQQLAGRPREANG
jgi:hypothetical protein